jgi:hypothetical protein
LKPYQYKLKLRVGVEKYILLSQPGRVCNWANIEEDPEKLKNRQNLACFNGLYLLLWDRS